MDLTVAVGTFGEQDWIELAQARAIPSAQALGVPVVHHHADTLHDARNGALAQVRTEWVVHLDADDELDPAYLNAMAAGTADVRAPSVAYFRNGRWTVPGMPHVWAHDDHDCVAECLPYGNWLVVGAAVRAELVREVGGWRDYEWSEDWDLWLRCHLAGASFEAVPAAVYRAHVRNGSRNRSLTHEQALEVHRSIARANGVPVP
jgi:GT2 family glycosyltransferase